MGCLGLGCGHGEGCRMSLWQLHRAYPASWTWCLSERYVLCSPMHLVSTISWIKVGVSVPKCFSPPNIFWLCDPRLLALNYWATLCHCVWIMIAFMWLNLAAWIYPNIEFQSPPGLLGLLANPVMKVWNPVTCFVSEWGSWRNIQCSYSMERTAEVGKVNSSAFWNLTNDILIAAHVLSMQVIRNEALIVLAYLTRSAEVPDFALFHSMSVYLTSLLPGLWWVE
jgi:hypothetical protein